MLGALLWFFLGTLHHAAWFDDLERMNAYLARGCDVNMRDSRGATPLFYAAAQGSVESARLLLLHGADPQATTSSGASPLHSALLQRQTALALLLIAEGTDVNLATTADGVTALHLAAYTGQREATAALLAAGAAVDALTARGQSPLYLAVLGMLTQGADDGCLRLLVAAGADPRPGDSAGMLRNARLNDEVAAAVRGALEYIGQTTHDTGLRAFVGASLAALAEDAPAVLPPTTLAEEAAALSPEAVFAPPRPGADATGKRSDSAGMTGSRKTEGPRIGSRTSRGRAADGRGTGGNNHSLSAKNDAAARPDGHPRVPEDGHPRVPAGDSSHDAAASYPHNPAGGYQHDPAGGSPVDPAGLQPDERDLPGNLAESIIQGLSGVLPRYLPSGGSADARLPGVGADARLSGVGADARSGAFPRGPEQAPAPVAAVEEEPSDIDAPLFPFSDHAAPQALTPEDQAALEALIAARGGPEGLEAVRERGRVAELSLAPPPGGRAWSVPREIGRFTALERLSISGGGLSEPLPDSIRRLTSLRYLHLAEYPFPALPEGLYALSRLEGLSLSRGEIRKLSERLGELRSLRSLRIAGTPLRSLPVSLGRLRHLERLDLLDLHLTALPASFGRLTALRECRLNGNGLRSLPAGLANCRSLVELDLGRNDLRVVPASISDLPALESLSLHGNGLAGPLPAMLASLPRLRYLNLSENAFTGPAPEALLTAPSLRVLILSANPGLSGPLPPCRGPGQLQTLAVHETGLTPAPEDAEIFLAEGAETRRLAGLAAFSDLSRTAERTGAAAGATGAATPGAAGAATPGAAGAATPGAATPGAAGAATPGAATPGAATPGAATAANVVKTPDSPGTAKTARASGTAIAAETATAVVFPHQGLAVAGTSSPLRLREALPGWFTSGQRALSLWGGSYAFSISFDTPRIPSGLDAPGAEALARRSLPAVNALLAQLAGMDREALLRQAAQQVFPLSREHLRYGTLEDTGEVPLRSAADLARHLYVGAVSVTIFPDAPPVLELTLETYQQFFGGRWVQVTLESGTITDITLQE